MSALPFPLPSVVDERYVILPIINGLARHDVLHLPATVKTYPIWQDRRNCTIRFDVRMRDGFSPQSWPSACGTVEKGSVYVQGGALERIPICPNCLAALREGDPPAPVVSFGETTDVAAAPTGEQPSPSLSLAKPTKGVDRSMGVCRIEGCRNRTPARGRFALVCVEHRQRDAA